MCMKSRAPTPPPVPVVAPAPTREQVVATQTKVANEKASTTIKSVNESKKKAKEQQGVYNNIKTSMSGDWYYQRRTKAQARFAAGDATPAAATAASAVARYGG